MKDIFSLFSEMSFDSFFSYKFPNSEIQNDVIGKVISLALKLPCDNKILAPCNLTKKKNAHCFIGILFSIYTYYEQKKQKFPI